MNKITPETWINFLEKAVESQKREANRQGRQYLAIRDNQYLLVSLSDIEKGISKLTLLKIVDISLEKFSELKDQLKKGTINKTTFIDLTSQLSLSTERLIDHREAKRNQFNQNSSFIKVPWVRLYRNPHMKKNKIEVMNCHKIKKRVCSVYTSREQVSRRNGYNPFS